MIEIGTTDNQKPDGNFRLEIYPDHKRDSETLLPLIQKHIAVGKITVIAGKHMVH